MKANFLPKLFVTKRIFWFLVLFATAGPAFGQSETNNPVTYDTTITETVAGQGTLSWLVRITRQLNDASQRPAIFCIPGSGEVGTDPANLVKFGAHYWLANGWDGSVKLDNGIHYPILVTIEQPGVNTRPWHLKALFDIILNILPIKRNSVHVSGLSQGSYEWGELISYAAFTGDEAAMSEIKSWVDFEGVGPGDNFSGFNLLHPFGHWAKKYGGRMFGLEGTNDSRNIWQITEEMNDSVGNTGYFCYENFGGGAHCCWNSMYDPSVTNWRCLGSVTNANLSPSTNPASTMGDYFVDPVTGTNVFQWMLRQGDTTLVGSATPPAVPLPTVSAGTTQSIQLPLSSVTLTGTAAAASGHSLVSTTWSKTSGPAGFSIVAVSSLSTSVTGLTAGTYVFTLTVKDDAGQTSTSTVTITVLAELPPTVAAGTGLSITLPVSLVTLTGTATGNGGATINSTSWAYVSGPATPLIASVPALSTLVTGLLTQGTYVFKLTATDNNGNSGSATVNVTVNPLIALPPPLPPTVSAGSAISITLPVSTASLTGTATGNAGSTVSTTTWSYTSGPNTPTITAASSLNTTVTGLIQGSYIFKLTAVDNNGNSATSTVTVTVNPAIVVPPPPPPPPTTPAPKTLVGVGEYQAFFIDQNKHLFGIGTNLRTIGVGGSGIAGAALPLAVPTTLTFKTVAGGLHGGAAVDNNSNVWTWGDNAQGENGDGTVSVTETMTPVQIMTDISGNPFTGVASLCAFFANNQSSGWYAVKSNGTLWVWGQTLWGMSADGTMGSSLVLRPTQVSIPGGRQVAQVVAGQILIVLCTDGTVWTCGGAAGNPQDLGYAATGTNYLSLHQLTTLSGITQIAGGSSFNYALKSNGTLYGWGYYGFDMGTGTNPIATPTDLSSVLSLPHPVVSIVTNMVCTHAILSDGTLWGWGDNANGTIGAGGEFNYATSPTPYAWDFYPYDLLQQVPVQITTRNDFVAVFGAQPFVLYTYAETSDGQLYSWGRNKTAVLGNGVVGCNSDVVALYPNSWDVLKATPVNPLSVTATTVVPSPWCLSHATTTPCNECTAGIIPLANAGAAITITLPVNSTTLDGSASSNPGGGTLTYAWTKISGPASFAITSPTAATTGLTGLVQGVYTFQLTVTNSAGYTATASVTVTVNPAPVITPVANAGNNITITLPVNTVTLDGSASSNPGGGTLTYAWTKISGPSGFTIVSPSGATTVINNLVQGVYQFSLVVTNSQGNTDNATVTVTVNPAPIIIPIADAGNDIAITLPVNTVTLDGSASNNPGGGVLTYAWTAISGPAGYSIISPSAATTTVTNLVQGSYIFQLLVTNSQGRTATSTVTVTVNDPVSVTPIASAGTAITITLPVNTVTLDGSGSNNPGGGTITYSWTEVSGPVGNTITTPTGTTTTVTNLTQGVYLFRLVVTNSQGNTASATVTVTVNPAPVIIPVANAGTAITITLPVNTVTLDGSASSNPGGGTLTYSWTEISGPAGNTITTPAGMTTTVTNLVQGVYQYRLVVTNSQGNTASATVTVTVNAAVAITPIANAGTAITITLPVNTVTLDGSASSNPGGGTLTYSWIQISGPAGNTITTPAGMTTTVTNLVQGVYQYRLIVTNSQGNTATASVTVTVNAAAAVTPIANAGNAITITLPVNSVTLDGSASNNPGGGTLTYSWTEISGPSLYNFASPTSVTTAVNNLVQGIYQFELTVTNSQGNIATASVTVTVNAAVGGNQPPIANAGINAIVILPITTVSLDGTKSKDPDGTIVSYSWVQLAGPTAGVSIAGAGTATPQVLGLTVGQYLFELTVTDNDGAVSTADVTVTVIANTSSSTLLANAGKDTTVAMPDTTAFLNGSGSTDAGGTINSYQWTQLSGPALASMSASSSPLCTVGGLAEGQYTFQLTVKDNMGNSSTAYVKVQVISNLRTAAADELLIYPNPAHDQVNLRITSDSIGTVRVNIYDIQGRMVKATEVSKQQSYLNELIDVSTLPAGSYILQVQIGKKKQMNAKLIKQ